MNALVPTLAERLRKWPPALTFALGLVYVLVIAALDYLTPGGLTLTIWYLLGVAAVAWGAGRGLGLVIAVVSAGGMFLGKHDTLGSVSLTAVWNTLSMLLVLVIVGWLTAEMARLTKRLSRLVEARTAQWQAEVRRHQEANSRLSETLEQFKQIADNILEVFWLFDPAAHKFLFVSRGFERIWGRDRQAFYASPEAWRTSLHPEERARQDLRPLQEKVTGPYEAEYRIVRPDGAVRWIRDRAFPVLNEQGQVHRIAGLAEDITAWKTAWHTLSTQAYILENMKEAVLMADEAGVILQTNAAIETLLGYPRAELVGRSVQFLSSAPPEEAQGRFEAILQETRAHGHAAGEHLVRRKDGGFIWVATQCTRLALNEGTFLVIVGQDITERKRSEEALRLSQRELGEALDLARLAHWEYDSASSVFTFDDRFYRLYGTTAEREGGYQMSAETYQREFLLPEDAHLVTERHAAVIAKPASEQFYQVEHRIRRRDGAIRHLMVRVAVTKDAAKGTVHIRGVNQDVTDLKQAEQERSEALELNRTLVAASPVGIAAFKASGECILANEALARLSGGTVQRHLEQNFRSLASWRATPLLAKAEATLKTGKPHRGDYHGTSSFGKAAWFGYGFAPFTLRGEPHLLLLTSDITERKQAEQRLADALDLNQKMLAASLVGIAAYRASGECVFANEVFGRMIGGALPEILAQSFRELESWKHSGLLQAAEAALHTGQSRSGEFCVVSSFGRTVWVDGHFTPFVSAGQQHLLLMCYDISERKRSEREVLEISDREQARIGQDLHDGLCQQLVSLAFDANALIGHLAAEGSPEAAIARRIADLLDQSITEARNVSRGLFPVRLEMDGLASAFQELAKTTAQRHRIRCTFSGSAPANLANRAQAVHLYRIVQEAVNNALKHAKPKSIRIELLTRPEQYELRIRDDGSGLSQTAADSPAGLGLHIMRYRAASLGGTLKVIPGAHGGTTICCCIPRPEHTRMRV